MKRWRWSGRATTRRRSRPTGWGPAPPPTTPPSCPLRPRVSVAQARRARSGRPAPPGVSGSRAARVGRPEVGRARQSVLDRAGRSRRPVRRAAALVLLAFGCKLLLGDPDRIIALEILGPITYTAPAG